MYNIRVLILLLCTFKVLGFSSQCCDEGSFLESTQCIGPQDKVEKIKLKCESGMYIIDPNEEPSDTFTEIKDTGELRVDEFYNVLANGTWCVARQNNSSQEVALACFSSLDVPESESPIVQHIYGALMLISCAFLVATLTVYALISELRDLQGKCLMANVTSLALGFLPLALIQFYGATISEDLCTFKAFFLYYWLLASFFWLNVVSFNVWSSVVLHGRLQVKEDTLFFIFCAYAWGIPAVFLTVALFIHFAPAHMKLLRPYFGRSRCWFHGPEETWAYFYGPVAILITVNMIFFATTAWRLWRIKDNGTSARVRSHRFKCLLYLKLFIVMGLSWVFEVISYAYGEMNWFWYLCDALNCLQGVLIFVILICRKRTMRAIATRKWGSALCPRYKQFEDMDEEDESGAMLQEDLEMSRPTVS